MKGPGLQDRGLAEHLEGGGSFAASREERRKRQRIDTSVF